MEFKKVLCLVELNLAKKGAFVMISPSRDSPYGLFSEFSNPVFLVFETNPDVFRTYGIFEKIRLLKIQLFFILINFNDRSQNFCFDLRNQLLNLRNLLVTLISNHDLKIEL